MGFNVFLRGEEVSLEDMMQARERRVCRQQELLQNAPTCTLVTLTLNIPGPIKHTPVLVKVFQSLKAALHSVVLDAGSRLSVSGKTGQEYYVTTTQHPKTLKQVLLAIEVSHPFGRFADLDVQYLSQQQLASISRQELGLPSRSCYLCGESAEFCSSNHTHTIEELQQELSRIILFNEELLVCCKTIPNE